MTPAAPVASPRWAPRRPDPLDRILRLLIRAWGAKKISQRSRSRFQTPTRSS